MNIKSDIGSSLLDPNSLLSRESESPQGGQGLEASRGCQLSVSLCCCGKIGRPQNGAEIYNSSLLCRSGKDGRFWCILFAFYSLRFVCRCAITVVLQWPTDLWTTLPWP